ncbi:hypothetical protein ACHAWT_007396 [Skeletonema menzelii]
MVDTTPLVDSEKEEKIGHKFCGCCCDSKRAVLVFNSLNLIGYLILIVLILASRSNIGAFWAFYIVGIGVFSLAIAGAALYNRWLVAPAALWAEISLVLTIVFSLKGTDTVVVDGQVYQASPVVNIVLALIWQGLVAYANWTFVYEVNKGIMSSKTYKQREEHSCCCV